MTALSIILGVLMIIAGAVCLFTPISTTFALMYFFIILLFVTGIFTFIRCIVVKSFSVDFVFSILTIILGIVILVSPYATFVTELVMVYMMAAWLVIDGIVGIVVAARYKRLTGGGTFAISLILSILTILVGIYSFIHPVFFSGFLGILASIFFIITGAELIGSAIVYRPEK